MLSGTYSPLTSSWSQVLGYGIILSACVVKVPQISAIARAGSARGLSCLAFELEQLGLSVNAANGFVRGLPFSAYGEALVLLAQNTVLLGQIYALSGTRGVRPALVATLFLGGGAAVLAGACAGSRALWVWTDFVDALVQALLWAGRFSVDSTRPPASLSPEVWWA